jgi:hypothetical protein
MTTIIVTIALAAVIVFFGITAKNIFDARKIKGNDLLKEAMEKEIKRYDDVISKHSADILAIDDPDTKRRIVFDRAKRVLEQSRKDRKGQ